MSLFDLLGISFSLMGVMGAERYLSSAPFGSFTRVRQAQATYLYLPSVHHAQEWTVRLSERERGLQHTGR